jgi:PKD repeat protein
MFKVIDNSVPPAAPSLEIQASSHGAAGETLTFAAETTAHWDFGDGTSDDGAHVQHAYTHAGDYQVVVTVTGLDSVTGRKTLPVTITGTINTRFEPTRNRREP